MTNFDRQFQDIFSLVASPLGLVGLILLLMVAIGAIVSGGVRWGALVVLLLSTTFTLQTFSAAEVDQARLYRPLMFPFETMRMQSRAISGAMVCILLLPSILALRGRRKTLVPVGLVTYFAFQVIFSILDIFVDPSVRTFLSLPLFFMIFLVMVVGINKTCQEKRDVNALLWAIVTAFSLMSVAVAIQMLAGDRAALFKGSRLQGTTGNPQFLSTSLAPALLVAIYLLLDKTQPKILRIVLSIITAVLFVFLFWTGSRTGALMTAMGVLVFFRLQLGKLLVVALVTTICVFGVLQFLGDEGSDQTGRFIGMQDTRSFVWQRQWSEFANSPLLGATQSGGGRSVGNGENSYLTVAASYGIVGLIPLGFVFLAMGRDMVRVWRVRKLLPEDKALVDLVLAVPVMAAVGAFFEVYLLGQFSTVVLILFICSNIGAYLCDRAEEQQSAEFASALTYDEDSQGSSSNLH